MWPEWRLVKSLGLFFRQITGIVDNFACMDNILFHFHVCIGRI